MGEPGSEIWEAVRGALSATRRAAPIERAERHGDPPLSWVQEGIWLHEQLHPRGGAFNTTLALGLDGALDAGALRAALEAIVRRHEILRTCCGATGGVPYQRVSRRLAAGLDRVDLSQLGAAARAAELERLAVALNRVPFDLRRPPLWRLRLVRLAPGSHALLLSVHHLVWDQSSYGVWLAELAEHYAAAASGAPAAGPDGRPDSRPDGRSELGVQYADLARWERREAEAGRLDRQVDHWRRALEGCSWHLELPRDRPRPGVPSFTGRSRWLRLDEELGAGLAELGRGAGTTLFMTLLAGYAALLARYGNGSEAVVGVPFSKRYRTELRPLIGPLINLLLLRLEVAGDPTVGELLERVRGVVVEAYANQDAPYERVTATMRPDDERSGGPRVQTMLSFYRMPSRAATAGGLELRPFELEDGKARMDLELYAWEAADGIHGRFIFDADLFHRSTMERIPGHFVNLLAGMVADPGRRLSELPLLGEAERRRLVAEWSGRPAAAPPGGRVHERFGEQARRTPSATALIAPGSEPTCRELTYRGLAERAERLAGHLHRRGIGGGGLVAVHLEREPGLIVALLAILRLGAAYVPLDLADPPDRTLLMLADSGATLLVTTAARRAQLGDTGVETLVLDELLAAPGDDPPPGGAGGPLAYVTYTSGSTGAPKGIAVPHGAVLDTVLDTDYLALGPGDRIAQAANISFDVATAEIWGALLNGATLVMLPPETILAPAALAAALESHRVDSLFLTTALFHRVASEAPHAFGGLRDLLVGGEVLDPHWVHRVLAHGAPRRLLNVYGPTETTAYSTWYRADESTAEGQRVPIGRPIGRARCYVLDRAGEPVPVGVAGELYLGGPGLAWGYHRRPALTAGRFVPDPFAGGGSGGGGGGRLYRTGDRVRFLADGNLEFLERIDDQVKIRGNRVEPGEIEAALALHPQVAECAVAVTTLPAREGVPREQRLVAYVVPAEGQLPEVVELHRFLKQRLPPYMVPTALVPITALPLTPSGKVDRLALAARGRPGAAAPAAGYVAPHNEVERRLAEIWKRVLWLDREVGIHDDFFDLGGHSLLASVLVAEVEKAFGTELPIGALFRLTTVSDLAGHLEPMVASLTESLARGLTAAEPDPAAGPRRLPGEIHHRLLAFTAGWRGRRAAPDGGLMVGLNLGGNRPPLFWCLQGFDELEQLARHLGGSQPVFGMRSGHLAMQFTTANIRALAAHYVGEILAAEPEGPYLVGGNCQGAYVAWAIAGELRRRGRPVPLLALQLFDYRHALPYGGRVALFFGADAGERFRASGAPEPAWSELYPAGFSVDPISGTERWHLVEPHVEDFAGKLARRIERALAAPAATAPAAVSSRGVVVLGSPGGGGAAVAELVRRLGAETPGSADEVAASRRVEAIHRDFLAAAGRGWDDPRPLPGELFGGAAAAAARSRLREEIDRLGRRPRWVLDAPLLGRLLPLWEGLVPAHVELRFLHALRNPAAVAAELAEGEALPPDKSLLVWLLHALDAELATRERQRSWLRLEALAAPPGPDAVAALAAAAGPVDDLERRLATALAELRPDGAGPAGGAETAGDALRFQPWASAADRALAGLAAGREIESRVALDALRFGLDDAAHRAELERIQGESSRLRERTHEVWRENRMFQEEIDRLRRELDDFQQRRAWRLTAPLRWLFSVVRRGRRPA